MKNIFKINKKNIGQKITIRLLGLTSFICFGLFFVNIPKKNEVGTYTVSTLHTMDKLLAIGMITAVLLIILQTIFTMYNMKVVELETELGDEIENILNFDQKNLVEMTRGTDITPSTKASIDSQAFRATLAKVSPDEAPAKFLLHRLLQDIERETDCNYVNETIIPKLFTMEHTDDQCKFCIKYLEGLMQG